ncbi:FtsX-like permease family protein (plasmid) [Iamia sp. SCSIO 61187]|uniref:ABC transporter permease n=1 Tax=Iamia sp. SCSIO 61187 TaxID=2722752 RepID=UPI001C62CDEE|nr:FtsX-like permease family protein [Iamia sp. SCSIO 61187]QYG94366.1 FtsX-like permease family protein [Iamia sp. SCSIO 61187]QYG95819.1 FtsX-like permease family protein [Iamia sp. SCSIO 61187]
MTRRLLARKTLRELRANRAQTIALASVIALGVTVFIAAIGAYQDLASSEATTYERLRLADAWYRIEPTDQSLVEDVATRPDVQDVEARLVIDSGLQVGRDRVRARLIGTSVTGPAAVNDVAVIDGQRPSDTDGVLLERTFAERRGIAPGDTVTALLDGEEVPLRVAATVATPEYLQVTPDRYELLPAPSSFAVIFIDRTQLQELTDNRGQVNDIVVRLDGDNSSTAAVEADLRGRASVIEATPRSDQASYAALEQDLGSFRAIAIAMPTIILAAGVIAMAVMMGRVVRSQRPLIGIMKALGYTDRTVLTHYLTHALVIGTIGSIVGVVAGSLLSGVVTRAYTAEIGVPYTTSAFHPALAALAVGVSLVAIAVATWHPARRSARLAPALATRIDPVGLDHPGRRSRIERLLPLPLNARLPLRTATRARGRAIGTASGIAAAMLLLLMVLALRDAVDLFITRTFDDLEQWDIAVTFDEPRDPAARAPITDTPGVTEASPFLQAPARLEARARAQDVLLTALDPGQDLRRLRLDGTTMARALAPGQIVLTDGLADDLGIDVGDSLTAATPTGPVRLRVSATSDEPIPSRAYVGLTTAAEVAGATVANGMHLRVEGDQATIRSALYDVPGVTAVAVRDEQRSDLRSLLSVFDALIAVMLAFSGAMAFAVLFNAMTINVLEREREYATMRSVGARPALIARLLALEVLVLWALALLPGLLAGTWVAARLGDAIAADLFTLEVRATPASYVIAAAGVLAIALLALLLPLRRVARLDLASATKTLG